MTKEIQKSTQSSHVFTAIHDIMKTLATRGIPKDLKIRYKERTVSGRSTEIIVQTLLPLLAENNLTLSFKTLNLVYEQNLWIATVEYTITSSVDNSSIVSVATGAAGQSEKSDKAIQNAMTYAYKNFFTQSFLIAEGSNTEDEVPIDEIPPQASPEKSAEVFNRAHVKMEELKYWLSENADSPSKQQDYGQKFYTSINHPKFPDNLRTQCLHLLTEYNIVNKMIL